MIYFVWIHLRILTQNPKNSKLALLVRQLSIRQLSPLSLAARAGDTVRDTVRDTVGSENRSRWVRGWEWRSDVDGVKAVIPMKILLPRVEWTRVRV